MISAVGPDDGRSPTTVYSAGVASIIAELRQVEGVRLVVISAIPVSPDTDKSRLERWGLHRLLWRFFGASYRDLRLMESSLEAADDVAWAVVRPPRLTDKVATDDVRRAWDVPLSRPRTISRAALAQVLLEVATAEPFRGGILTVSQ